MYNFHVALIPTGETRGQLRQYVISATRCHLVLGFSFKYHDEDVGPDCTNVIKMFCFFLAVAVVVTLFNDK